MEDLVDRGWNSNEEELSALVVPLEAKLASAKLLCPFNDRKIFRENIH